MNLPAIFSLIFAALISLLPVLLLMGRRAVQNRSPRPGDEEGADTRTPPGANSHGTEAQPIMGRLSDRAEGEGAESQPRTQQPRTQQTRPAREIYTRGQRPQSLEQELRDASRIAGRSRQRVGRLASSPAPARRPQAEVLEARLSRLTPLQRAVVYSELLGSPAGLRRPGRREEV